MEVWIDNERMDEVVLRRCDECAALILDNDYLFHWERAHGDS